MRCPAALPALSLGAGIGAAVLFLPPPPVAAALIPLILLAGAATALAAGRDRLTVVLAACGFVSGGVVLGGIAESAARHTPLRAYFDRHLPPGEHQLPVYVEGRLRADAVPGPSGVTLDLRIDRIRSNTTSHATSGGTLVGVGGGLMTGQTREWRAGRRLAFPATLRRPTRYLNAGVPDGEHALARRGVALVGSVKSDRLVEVVARGSAWAEASASARAAVRAAITSAVSPWSPRSGAIVSAILIGDRAGLDEDVERRLQEAGTYHVIAISGGNIAILAGACLLVLRAMRLGPRLSALVVILLLGAYAQVVEGGSSVGRATLVAGIYFAARIADHRTPPLNAIALTAVVLLCASPLQIADAGFALTFGATLGILAGARAVAGLLPARRWLRPPAALLVASVSAEIALLPVAATVFSRVTCAGLAVNFAAIPLMAVVQIAGMAAVAASAAAPGVAPEIGWVAHLAVEGLVGSARLVDLVPWLSRRVAAPPWWLAGAYYAALAALVVLHSSGARRFCAGVAAACGLGIVTAPGADVPRGMLRVTYFDVGQGDASVVQFPGGRTLGIDAGGLAQSRFDIGGRVVSPALWALGVRRLDYLSLSHADGDHIGGAASVVRDFRPLEVWEGVPVPPHAPARELRRLADASGVVWRTLQPLDRAQFGPVDLLVHHPPRPEWERQRVRNDDSAVLEIRYGGVSFVFAGDIGRDVERTIASGFTRVPVRILKVPHHGSATSSSPGFLEALRPDIAVISAGRGNPFGHPAPVVVERYRQLGAAIYRTDLDGAVTVETDGTTVRVRTFTGRRLTVTTKGRP